MNPLKIEVTEAMLIAANGGNRHHPNWNTLEAAITAAFQHPEFLAQLNQWRPIGSAPRDGTVFLTFIPDMEGEDAFDFAYWSDEWGDFAKVNCGFQYVTHWRPLPPPPGEG